MITVEHSSDPVLNRISESYFSIRTYSVRRRIDLYRGCQFDCAYCFAASYKRGQTDARRFGSDIVVDANAPAKLDRELRAVSGGAFDTKSPEYTCLGTTTDSYQPVERRYRLTRKCLRLFLEREMPVSVLTKSNLCERDIDLWSRLAERDLAAVGFTLTMPTNADPTVKRMLEPLSPSAGTILRTLEAFVGRGIKTYVFVEPVVPFVTDEDYALSQLLREISLTGNKKVHFGVLKLTPGTWERLRARLRHYDCQLIPSIENLYFDRGAMEFRDSWLPSADYRHQLYEYARSECQTLNLGFSCEGEAYGLWLDDWATVQDPFRYPTGYDIWKIIHEHEGSLVTLTDVLDELRDQFQLTPDYVRNLAKLWRERLLFDDLEDVGWTRQDANVSYYYHQ